MERKCYLSEEEYAFLMQPLESYPGREEMLSLDRQARRRLGGRYDAMFDIYHSTRRIRVLALMGADPVPLAALPPKCLDAACHERFRAACGMPEQVIRNPLAELLTNPWYCMFLVIESLAGKSVPPDVDVYTRAALDEAVDDEAMRRDAGGAKAYLAILRDEMSIRFRYGG